MSTPPKTILELHNEQTDDDRWAGRTDRMTVAELKQRLYTFVRSYEYHQFGRLPGRGVACLSLEDFHDIEADYWRNYTPWPPQPQHGRIEHLPGNIVATPDLSVPRFHIVLRWETEA